MTMLFVQTLGALNNAPLADLEDLARALRLDYDRHLREVNNIRAAQGLPQHPRIEPLVMSTPSATTTTMGGSAMDYAPTSSAATATATAAATPSAAAAATAAKPLEVSYERRERLGRVLPASRSHA